MFAMNLGKLNVNEAELKAYIYQQLNDIQPYLGETPVAIKMTYTNDNEFFVKILANHEVGDIEAQGMNADVYSAILEAKNALIKSVSVLDDEDESEETHQRDADIQNILNNDKKQIH